MPNQILNTKLIRIALAIACVSLATTTYATNYQDAVAQLGYSELAATFSRDKALAISTLPDEEKLSLPELKAAATLQLIGAPIIGSIANSKTLAEFIANYNQPDTAYLGQLNESSLYQRIETQWKTQSAVKPSAFALELRQLIGQGIATGYNLVTTSWPLFEADRHIIYGHSDIDHAQQLLALLASEGLQARVGFSRKTSAFLYRDDWGTLSQSLIDLGNGRRLVEASEYDLHFEFPTAADKTKFVATIDRYAKKDTANQTGLIRSAWWQPFYRSKNAAEGFASATQIAVSNGKETALLLALPNQAPALVKAIQQLNPTWSVSPEAIWVNLAFHRYLQGGYK
ncbi:hypothetical protein [Cellvibrio fibrivorans]|uniref:Uncharacterized protein n=1 Tax=Cellvibrio fibrivorans TaxID=126350 RepID=A0ABU1UZL9_9GAMM|nr:hypothetical protein [Cellvibrio fibrivorans]MDR7090562.1 hypothetical protein [Cellvibrio fibrivorans]